MPTITTTDDTITVHLSRSERWSALTGDVRVPRDLIVATEIVDEPLSAVRGLRSPGLSVPGRVKIGTWRRRGHKELVVARRGQRALRMALRGHRFDSLLLGVDDPEALAAQLTPATH